VQRVFDRVIDSHIARNARLGPRDDVRLVLSHADYNTLEFRRNLAQLDDKTQTDVVRHIKQSNVRDILGSSHERLVRWSCDDRASMTRREQARETITMKA
jgi:hypothetical protein